MLIDVENAFFKFVLIKFKTRAIKKGNKKEMEEKASYFTRFFKKSLENNAFPFTVAVSSLALFFVSQQNFLLFHLFVEVFTTVIAFGIFVIAWSSRRYIDNNFLLILGIGYFFIGVLDLIHMLSYKGMPAFSSYTTDLPTQLWLSARYMEALTFLGALLFLKKDSKSEPRIPTGKSEIIFLSYFFVFALIIMSIFYWKFFPATYIEGGGLTAFKKNSEYIISIIFLISVGLIFWKKERFDSKMVSFLSFALIIKAVSEFLFTEYAGVFDFSNILGHLLKFISFALLYKAVLEIGLMNPYQFLFLDLKKSQAEYRATQSELQRRIEEHLDEAYRHLGTTNRKISLLLEIEENSQKNKNRDEIIEHIVSLAKSASHAKKALLYRSERDGLFSLIAGRGYDEDELKNLKNISFSQANFLKNLMEEKKRINSSCDLFELSYLNHNKKISYFVVLPLIYEKVCAGFLFLGFEKRKSMDAHELEFLDVFSVHASTALARLKVIRKNNNL